MNDSTQRPAWMSDDLVKDISPKKLAFLEEMFRESQGKDKKSMMTFLMPMMKKAKQENLTFTPAEMNAAITAIKKYSTADEIAQMDKILEKAHNHAKS
uniref:hypothetical protein n=1 Tax=Acetatifactor sp. TaxID=1872090 RepID=UPI0040569DC3